jgi:hypothetical protein
MTNHSQKFSWKFYQGSHTWSQFNAGDLGLSVSKVHGAFSASLSPVSTPCAWRYI